MGPAMKALSGRQREFAIHMATGEVSGAEAARRAGYSEKTARLQATRLLTKDNVKAAIDEVMEAAIDETIMTRHKALLVVSGIADDIGEHGNVRIKAVDTLSKMEGWNAPDKVETTLKGDPNNPLVITPEDAYKEMCNE